MKKSRIGWVTSARDTKQADHAFIYEVDTETEPARDRRPMSFTEVYLAHVGIDDFRSNPRGELGMRTATLHRDGVRKLREHWVYKA